jgi:hypothetical protein
MCVEEVEEYLLRLLQSVRLFSSSTISISSTYPLGAHLDYFRIVGKQEVMRLLFPRMQTSTHTTPTPTGSQSFVPVRLQLPALADTLESRPESSDPTAS